MRVLTDGWHEGYLDRACAPGQVRIAVRRWHALLPVEDQYFVRRRDWRLLWNYLRSLGPLAVWRKVRSRLGERERNRKLLSVGVGEVVEAPGGGFAPGAAVAFVAPNHPLCVERVVVDERLVATLAAPPGVPAGELWFQPPPADEVPAGLAELAGWSPSSGWVLDRGLVADALAWAEVRLVGKRRPAEHRLPLGGGEVCEQRPTSTTRAGATRRPRAVVFGLGQYAKTMVIPNLARHLEVVRVHEIDPVQIGRGRRSFAVDTSPEPRPGEEAEVWVAAGFHHTHAPLAARALAAGAAAVVEKPLATTPAQLEQIEPLVRPGARLFVGFQRRYSAFNELAWRDLGVAPGEAIDYHAIAYEVPLPARHWYRWPASGSRLLSNGCHWTDHFLYLNRWSEVARHEVTLASGGLVSCFVELVNGAVFTLTLTERGSDRLGVRDVVDLRAGRVTVRIVDSSLYRAEDSRRVLRRRRLHPLEAHRRMYRTIAAMIAAGHPGDPPESLRSARLVLALEDDLAAAAAAAAAARTKPHSGAIRKSRIFGETTLQTE